MVSQAAGLIWLEEVTWFMAAIDDDVSGLIMRYAQHWWPRCDGIAERTNLVFAPAGAWLLLALAADAEPGRTCAVLGLEPQRAMQLATALLGQAPTALRSATAMWVAADQQTAGLARWQDELPAQVASGPVPTAQQADAWATAATDGLISRFPVAVSGDTALVLANALVADVRWRRPYAVRSSEGWGIDHRGSAAAWAERVSSILVGEDVTAVRTERGLYAVHQAQADGLTVLCITGAPEVEGMAAASEVLRAYVQGSSEDLWSLPLGVQGCWRVEEEPIEDSPTERVLRTEVRLPAWEAESSWDLMGEPDVGFIDAARRIAMLLADPGPAQAAQSARARFDRLGFTAAAVTALAITRAAPPRDREPISGVLRKVRVDFAQPFAVFALVDEPDTPWHQVMAFAAWIREPADPQHTCA